MYRGLGGCQPCQGGWWSNRARFVVGLANPFSRPMMMTGGDLALVPMPTHRYSARQG